MGKDVGQDPRGDHPPPAPDKMRPPATRAPAGVAESRPWISRPGVYESKKIPTNSRTEARGREVPYQQDESARKAEIRKAVKEDNPDNKRQGQERVGYSGGT